MIGAARPGGDSVPGVTSLLERTRQLTSRPFGVNFVMAHPEDIPSDSLERAASEAQVVEFFYHWPMRDVVELVHRNGALVSWQVGSRDEAVAAEQAGCDLIVAQGFGAGGHVRGTIGVLALLGDVLEVVQVPVLAAGGIGTGRALAAALAAGASGVRVGTRFVASEESNAHPAYVAALIAAQATDTVYTEAFSTNWPNAPHRVLRSCIAAATAFPGEVVGETPNVDGTRQTVHRFDTLAVDQGTTGAIDAMSLWAGESVGSVKRVQPAAEIVRELAGEAEELLRRW
jgi:NAD(P)H-dependent flavin oxidoreductase YrpB (nitropropane dioxygenase family)